VHLKLAAAMRAENFPSHEGASAADRSADSYSVRVVAKLCRSAAAAAELGGVCNEVEFEIIPVARRATIGIAAGSAIAWIFDSPPSIEWRNRCPCPAETRD
jgi:hypothetical protein